MREYGKNIVIQELLIQIHDMPVQQGGENEKNQGRKGLNKGMASNRSSLSIAEK